MTHRIVIGWILTCVMCVAPANSNEHNLDAAVSDSEQDFTVYFLRSSHPLSKFDSSLAPSIEEIILARNHENSLMQTVVTSSQTKGILTESEYETSAEDKCKYNNGSCSHTCETVSNQAICSCHEGFSLVGKADCQPISQGTFVSSGTSGRLKIDEKVRHWIIRAPEKHIIELEFSRYNGLPSYGQMYDSYNVYDGDDYTESVLQPNYCSYEECHFRSSGSYLYIDIGHDWSYKDVFAVYKTGLPYFIFSSYNRISLHVTGMECYSFTYSGDLNVVINNGHSEWPLTPKHSFKHHHLQWTTSTFQVNSDRPETMQFSTFYENTKFLIVRECLDIEYQLLNIKQHNAQCYNGGTWNEANEQCLCDEGFYGKHCQEGLHIVCQNGGIWNGAYKSCTCPPGFVGAYCEEGCGPNRYGENCTKVCSVLSNECQGAIFCRANVCSCAPGLQGPNCDVPCLEEQYGSSCQQYCGWCRHNTTCDRYTGKCYSGCAPGYYPPLCQQSYKVVRNAPEILEIDYKYLKFRASLWSQSGQGQPKFYEVQYKVENEESWSKLTPRIISHEVQFEINNLLAGHFYVVRIILIDQDGGSCHLNVPETKVMTKCTEPFEADYSLTAKEISENELTLEWSYIYDVNTVSCPVKELELSLMSGTRQLIFPALQKEGNKTLSGLLPNTDYRFQLTGITEAGTRLPSEEITVHTLLTDPGKVVNVQVVSQKSNHKLNITWQPPWNSAGLKMKYYISYTCLTLLACGFMDHPLPNQELVVEATSALIEDVQPHALYQIEIAAMKSDGLAAEGYIINITTQHTAPQVAPSVAENGVVGVTNVSACVNWLPPLNCSSFNGYLYGYSYKLIDNETGNVLKEITVQENVHFANFTMLKPNHCYDAHIAVVSSGGVDFSHKLVLPFCTSPTAPDQVQFLKVYKRSRKMVGLKWARPFNTYGEIDSFVISYNEIGTDTKIRTTVEPKRCHPWPDFFCHTISHLSPSRKYSFTVQARNNKVNADGEPATVEAVTTEGASTAPVNLTVTNTTESSVTLEWQLPDNINGYLRSFIIMTGEDDTKGASDECCDSIPLVDYRVNSEDPSYRYEISGLSAASTYSVTVAAKTLTLGEEAHVTAHTYPPKELLAQNAIAFVKIEDDSDKSETVFLKIQPAARVHGVKRTYFLLLLSNTTSTRHVVNDDQLTTLLGGRLTDNYHLISKYTQEELEEHPLIMLHLGDLELEDTDIRSCRYALVLIQDYMGNKSLDISVSKTQ